MSLELIFLILKTAAAVLSMCSIVGAMISWRRGHDVGAVYHLAWAILMHQVAA